MSRTPATGVAVAIALAALISASAAAQTPQFAPPQTIDGPSADVQALGNVSVAQDGTGGLVYLKTVGGVSHVFASVLQAGQFQPAVQLDAALPGPSSEPVLAAGNGGLLLIAFINAGALYTVTQPATGSPAQPPALIYPEASNPAIALSIHGKGYLAFTAGAAAPRDVRAAYWLAGTWSLASGVLDASPGEDSGAGSGRPAVAAAGDGVGIVAWGEGGHVYTRRVWGTTPSTAHQQADPPEVAGSPELSAGQVSIAAGDDSSYVDLAFVETVASGGSSQDRVLFRRLRGPSYDPVSAADGITGAGESAGAPGVALSPASRGLMTSSLTDTGSVTAEVLGNGGVPIGMQVENPATNFGPAFAVPATTGNFSGLVAWQQQALPGAPAGEIDARFFDGTGFGTAMTASTPALGPTDAARGLSAHGDGMGNVAIAWVQGTPDASAIVAGRLFYPPGTFAATGATGYVNAARPLFSWLPARETWGPVDYSVTIDGQPAGVTQGLSFQPPSPLADGPHTWQVTATNMQGQSSTARASSVWVDTVAPVAQLTLTGVHRAGRSLALRVRFSDAPPPEPARSASGVPSVAVTWGDGSTATVRGGARHAYPRAGRYRLRIVVSDRAGNATALTRIVRVAS